MAEISEINREPGIHPEHEDSQTELEQALIESARAKETGNLRSWPTEKEQAELKERAARAIGSPDLSHAPKSDSGDAHIEQLENAQYHSVPEMLQHLTRLVHGGSPKVDKSQLGNLGQSLTRQMESITDQKAKLEQEDHFKKAA